MSITTSYFSQMDSNGFTITGKCKHYQTYQEMLADTKPGQYGTVQDASGDPQFTTAPKGMVVYERKNDEWQLSYGLATMDSQRKIDHTAFRVYVTPDKLEVGSTAGTSHEQFIGVRDVAYAVNGSLKEAFVIRSNHAPADNDIMIDWGDGQTSWVKDFTTECTKTEQVDNAYYKYSDTEYRYLPSHMYAEAGVYTVRIYGECYFGIIGGNGAVSIGGTSTCRIYQIFEKDLPIASHITNYSSLCRYANLLFEVNVSRSNLNKTVHNASLMLAQCKNLKRATGFSYTSRLFNSGSLFSGDSALIETDYYIPMFVVSCASTLDGCKNLEANIADIAYNGVQAVTPGSKLKATNLFNQCVKLYGTVPAEVFWDNPNVTWSDTAKAFNGCSDEIRAQVPVSWGGTMEA